MLLLQEEDWCFIDFHSVKSFNSSLLMKKVLERHFE